MSKYLANIYSSNDCDSQKSDTCSHSPSKLPIGKTLPKSKKTRTNTDYGKILPLGCLLVPKYYNISRFYTIILYESIHIYPKNTRVFPINYGIIYILYIYIIYIYYNSGGSCFRFPLGHNLRWPGFAARWGPDSGISMGFLWDFYGISMGFLWDFYGISMGSKWDFYGI